MGGSEIFGLLDGSSYWTRDLHITASDTQGGRSIFVHSSLLSMTVCTRDILPCSHTHSSPEHTPPILRQAHLTLHAIDTFGVVSSVFGYYIILFYKKYSVVTSLPCCCCCSARWTSLSGDASNTLKNRSPVSLTSKTLAILPHR